MRGGSRWTRRSSSADNIPRVVRIDEMAATWHRRQAERKARSDARADAIRARLPAVKQLLTSRFGARRVVLFGSFARGDTTERSDVDLAVEGLDHLGYFPALAAATGSLDSPVDLAFRHRA
jgi:predicted nucleotidyltransferase